MKYNKARFRSHKIIHLLISCVHDCRYFITIVKYSDPQKTITCVVSISKQSLVLLARLGQSDVVRTAYQLALLKVN